MIRSQPQPTHNTPPHPSVSPRLIVAGPGTENANWVVPAKKRVSRNPAGPLALGPPLATKGNYQQLLFFWKTSRTNSEKSHPETFRWDDFRGHSLYRMSDGPKTNTPVRNGRLLQHGSIHESPSATNLGNGWGGTSGGETTSAIFLDRVEVQKLGTCWATCLNGLTLLGGLELETSAVKKYGP